MYPMSYSRFFLGHTLALALTMAACGDSSAPEATAETEDPISAASMDVRVKLESIYVHDEADGSGNAEPYLWPLFFKVDMDTITNLAPNKDPLTAGNVPWFVAPNGNHGNIGGSYDAGDTIIIPASVGEQRFTLKPGLVPTAQAHVGALVVLLEEDDAPPSSMLRDAYKQFAGSVVGMMRDQMICGMTNLQRALFKYTKPASCPPAVANPKTAIPFAEQQIFSALKDNFDHWIANVDDVIGVKMYIWTFDDLVGQPRQEIYTLWNGSTGSEDGDFSLTGYAETDISGDTCNNAATIEPTESVSLLISEQGDQDFFRVVLPQAGHLVLTTTGSSDTVGSLRNASCVEIAGDDDGGAARNFSINRRLAAGTYYISVREYAHASTGSYHLHSVFTPDPHGDFGGDATAVTAGSTTNGRIAPAFDVDMFEIQVSSGGLLTAYSTGSTDTIADLYGPGSTGIIASSDDEGSGRNFRISRTVSPGKYYIAVRTYNSASTGSYQLRVDFSISDDHANGCWGATSVNPISSSQASLESAGDIDFFRVDVTWTRSLKVYSSGDLDTYGQLLDSNCNVLVANDDGGVNRNFRFSRVVAPGTYYISVRHYSPTATGNYRMLVNPIE